MKVEIVTPEATVYTGDAEQVGVPGGQAPFTMLHRHQAIVSTLLPGVVRLSQADGSELLFDLEGQGVVEQHDDVVTILARQARARTHTGH